MSMLLTIKDLCITLQDKVVLSSLDLGLVEGDILGLVGPSGCGKTTLLNAIAGFVKPNAGTINIEDTLLSDAQFCLSAEQRKVGMIFQDYALFPHLNVFDNIAFGISKLKKEDQRAQVTQLLSTLKLSEYADSYIHQLSGGQQQRVAIARALAPKPRLLLLDEPFSNIDARLRNELMIEIRQLLKQFNTTAIFVTHNKDEVFTFADKMAVMSQGKLLQFDNPNTICQKPNSYQVADFLQLGSWLPCTINSKGINSLLGQIDYQNATTSFNGVAQLLVKPQHLIMTEADENSANARVAFMSVTEQGYHYHLCSLDEEDNSLNSQDKALPFNRLSIYSELVLEMNQPVALKIKPHDYLLFEK